MLKPKTIDDVTAAFPASLKGLLPRMSHIPSEFSDGWNEWNTLASQIFFGCDKDIHLEINPKVDPKKAWRHINTCLRSFEPKHEHKIAGVAYLLSLWFLSFELKDSSSNEQRSVHFFKNTEKE